MAAHSSILAWEIPWAEEPGGLQSMGSKKESHTHTHTHTKDGLVTTQPQMIALNFCSPPKPKYHMYAFTCSLSHHREVGGSCSVKPTL